MGRLHLMEIGDQSWCPRGIRYAITDYLQFVAHLTDPYGPIVPRLREALARTKAERVVDLGSGSGGPWLRLHAQLNEGGEDGVEVLLTDKYPNLDALRRIQRTSGNRIRFHPDPVDATRTPPELSGFRTLFASFHHFPPDEASAILRDAVRRRQGIGVFEMTHRGPVAILLMGLAPFLVLLFTPFVRPFRWSRLLWTYLPPLFPIVALFDGVVSCLRTYSPSELAQLTEEFSGSGYRWEIGEERSGPGPVPVTYLIGYPEGEAPVEEGRGG